MRKSLCNIVQTKLKDDYDHMQTMIFGEKIPFDTILDGIAKLEKEMNEITWTLAEKVGFEPMCPLRQTHFELLDSLFR